MQMCIRSRARIIIRRSQETLGQTSEFGIGLLATFDDRFVQKEPCAEITNDCFAHLNDFMMAFETISVRLCGGRGRVCLGSLALAFSLLYSTDYDPSRYKRGTIGMTSLEINTDVSLRSLIHPSHSRKLPTSPSRPPHLDFDPAS